MRFQAVLGAALCTASVVFPQSSSPPATTKQQIESHSRQAQEFLSKGQSELAVREYNAILKLDPNNLDARGNLGVTLFFRGDYANAATNLRAAVKERPNLWNIQALLGMTERRIGQLAAAQADLEKSFPQIQEQKLRVQAGMELIEIYYGAGSLDKASGLVNVLRQVAPENTDVLYTAYRIYSDLAGESMLSIAMLAPNSARMHQITGQEMSRHGDIEGAVAHYREAIKLDPKLPGLRFELAEALNLSNSAADQQSVEKEYQAALADDPLDEKSESRLGDIALRGSNVKAALDHYQRAVELQPNDADACLGLGRVLTEMQRAAEAEQYLKRAVQLDPFMATAHYRLGLVYRATGRPAEAQKELAEFERLKQMKERLKQLYQDMRLQPLKQDKDLDGGK
jgi:tetratricopeptide (TPR) repeat protein